MSDKATNEAVINRFYQTFQKRKAAATKVSAPGAGVRISSARKARSEPMKTWTVMHRTATALGCRRP